MIKIFNILFFILLIIVLFLKPDFESTLDARKLLLYSSIFLGSTGIHLYKYSKIYKNWFRLDVFFLLGFAIVHFQWPIMFSASGIIPEIISRVWVDELYVNYGTWLSTVGGISWILGFSFINSESFSKRNIRFFQYKKFLNFTIFLFILFLITAGQNFLTGGVYKGEGGSAAGEGISAYIQILFSVSIILLTAIIILNNKSRYNNNLLKWFFSFDKKYLVLYFTYLLLFLFIGDRDGPISLILTTGILIGSMIHPFKLRTLLITIFVGGFFMSIISLGRSRDSGIGIFSAGLENFTFTSGYDITLELATSVRTLYAAVSEVPQKHDFFYGKLWTSNLLSPFPFAQSVYLDLTNDVSYELGSAGYITYLSYGPDPSMGAGTSLIADIYLNFGVVGIIFFMFLLGLTFKKANNSLKSADTMKWILVAAILASFSIYFGRGSLLLVARPIIWSFFLLYIFGKLNTIKN